jgi:signal transduction histidine kinase
MNPSSLAPRHSPPGSEGTEKVPAGGRKAATHDSATTRMRSKVALAFGAALACVAGVAALQYQAVRRLNQDNDRVSHNQSLLRQLDSVRGSLNRADASVQGFVATGETSFRTSFRQAVTELKQSVQELGELTADNSVQHDKFRELESLANESLRAMQTESDARRNGELSPAALLPMENAIRKLTRGVRALSGDMEVEEFRALQDWSAQAQAANRQTNLLIWLGCLVACVLLGSAGIGLYADLTERGKAEFSRAIAYAALQQSKEKLEAEISERREAQAQLQDSERRMRNLSLRVLKLQDEEHRRIGRELHDSLGQYLTALKMLLDTAQSSLAANLGADRTREELGECSKLLEDSIREVRTMSYLLHPPLLEECGLRSAIPSYVEGFSKRSGIRVTVDIAPNFTRLPADVELAFFRVLQESLTNVHRHSGSATAHVRVAAHGDVAVLEVADQGKGISAESRSDLPRKAGVGLHGMTERMRQLGGDLLIESGENGTTVRVTIPQAAKPLGKAASA